MLITRLPQSMCVACLVKFLVIPLLALSLSGCINTVRVKVNAFKSPQWSDAAGSIYVASLNPELEPSLEFAHYRSALEAELVKLGFSLADQASAEYVALLDYSIEEAINDERKSHTSVYVGSGAVAPRYTTSAGVVVVDDKDRPSHRRYVTLVIAQNDEKNTRVYEVKGLSVGRCSVMSKVFTPILRGMLKTFPAEDGALLNVTVEGSDSC